MLRGSPPERVAFGAIDGSLTVIVVCPVKTLTD